MGQRRKPLSRARARKTADRMVERLTQEQARVGVVPSAAQAKAFIAGEGILERLDHEHEADRNREMLVPSTPTPAAEAADLATQVAHAESLAALRPWEDAPATVTPDPALAESQLEEQKRGVSLAQLRQVLGAQREEFPETLATRLFIRFLRTQPRWKARMEKLCNSGKSLEALERPTRQLLFEAAQAFPDKVEQFRRTARQALVLPSPANTN